MNINTLPTDSLYKFIAISGLILSLLGIVYLRPQLWALEVDIVKLEAEVNFYEQDLKKHKPNFEKSLLDRTSLLTMVIKTGELKTKYKQLSKLYYYSQISTFFGLVLMVFGFYLWYFRIQKPMDLLLKSQVVKK